MTRNFDILVRRPPNRWRGAGERRAEGDERVRCTRVLGGEPFVMMRPVRALIIAVQTRKTSKRSLEFDDQHVCVT
jgi:hypothetical protein